MSAPKAGPERLKQAEKLIDDLCAAHGFGRMKLGGGSGGVFGMRSGREAQFACALMTALKYLAQTGEVLTVGAPEDAPKKTRTKRGGAR